MKGKSYPENPTHGINHGLTWLCFYKATDWVPETTWEFEIILLNAKSSDLVVIFSPVFHHELELYSSK